MNVLTKMDLLHSSCGTGADGTPQTEGSDDDGDGVDGDDCGTSPLPFHLEFFTQCHDLHRLVDYLDAHPSEAEGEQDCHGGADPSLDYREDPDYQKARHRTRSSAFVRKYRRLHTEICSVVEDYGLLSFLPLSIQDAESVGRVLARIDKCNGYVFLGKRGDGAAHRRREDRGMQDLFSSAMVADSEWAGGALSDVQEKYLGGVMFRENIAELSSTQACRRNTDQSEKNAKESGEAPT